MILFFSNSYENESSQPMHCWNINLSGASLIYSEKILVNSGKCMTGKYLNWAGEFSLPYWLFPFIYRRCRLPIWATPPDDG